jgi:hypothetical protein
VCQFKSAIVAKDESSKGGFRLLMSPWTESHSELVTIFKLHDGARLTFARVEFSPESMAKAHLVETYKLKIDEERTPEWFDCEMKEQVSEKLRAYIKSIIVSGDVDLLIGGQFIVAPGAKVASAHTMVINTICGGTVSEISGGTVSAICGGTVSAISGGTVSEISGGTVSAICGGTVSAIWGGTVSAICGGTVSEISGGTVSEISGGTVSAISGGTVSAIRGGTVSEIRGGTVSAIRGGTVSAIRGGTVSEICGGTVSEIFDTFTPLIGKIIASAKILADHRKKKAVNKL